jgi:hypothetical protein
MQHEDLNWAGTRNAARVIERGGRTAQSGCCLLSAFVAVLLRLRQRSAIFFTIYCGRWPVRETQAHISTGTFRVEQQQSSSPLACENSEMDGWRGQLYKYVIDRLTWIVAIGLPI